MQSHTSSIYVRLVGDCYAEILEQFWNTYRKKCRFDMLRKVMENHIKRGKKRYIKTECYGTKRKNQPS